MDRNIFYNPPFMSKEGIVSFLTRAQLQLRHARLLIVRSFHPMPYLPPEILLPIFAHVQNDPASPFPNLDLTSCTLVCRLWYEFAFPLLEAFNQHHTCRIGKFNPQDLERLVDLLATSQQYGLAHGALIIALDIDIHQLLMLKYHTEKIGRRRFDAIGRLLRVLRSHLKGIMLDLQDILSPTDLKNFREIVVRLLPDLTENITSLHISRLKHDDHKSIFKNLTFSFSKPSPAPNTTTHPICLLIDHLGPHLHNFHLFDSNLPPPIIHSLRECPNLRTLRITRFSSKVTEADLADAVSRWSHLRHLTILDMDRDDYTRLGPTITRLASAPPPHLSTLELDNCWPRSPSCDLRSLISSCAQTLVTLTLPTMYADDDHANGEDSSDDDNGDNGGNSSENSTPPNNSFLDFLAGLDMPRLRILDMSRAGAALVIRSTEQAAVSWPELRCLDAISCNRFAPGFLRRVILGCPRLEDLRISYAHERIVEVEKVMQEANGFVKKEEKMEGGCGQRYCESCALVRFVRS